MDFQQQTGEKSQLAANNSFHDICQKGARRITPVPFSFQSSKIDGTSNPSSDSHLFSFSNQRSASSTWHQKKRILIYDSMAPKNKWPENGVPGVVLSHH